MPCAVIGCQSAKVYARGWCKMHYERSRVLGSVGGPAPRHRGPAAELRGPWAGCWEWQGSTSDFGHGTTRSRGKTEKIHRLVYEAIYGPIPAALDVCHHCDNPPCFRPDHLFVGTAADNAADMVAKGRSARGERQGHARLTENDVRAIRRARGVIPGRELAAAYGVRPSTICDIIKRRTWAWLD